MGRYQKFTDEELLQVIRNKYQELGVIPKVTDFSKTFSSSIPRKFNSYHNALALAGIITLKEKEIKLRNVIKNLFNDIKIIPSVQDLKNYTSIPYEEFYKQFGSWHNAIREAEIKIPKYTKDELLIYLNNLSIILNKVPSIADMKKYSIIGSSVYIRTFDGWNKAIQLAELVPNQFVVLINSKSDLIKKLQMKYLELGRIPMCTEMSTPSYQIYRLRFGSWEKALNAAGMEIIKKEKKIVIKEPHKSHKKYTKEFLCESLITLYNELRRIPIAHDLKPPYPSYKRYYECFGSFEKALLEVELVDQNLLYFTNNSIGYGINILIEELQKRAKELKSIPMPNDIEIDKRYYLRRFGTWNNAIYNSGLLIKNNIDTE